MGRGHATMGAVVWLGVAEVGHLAGLEVAGWPLVLGTVICAGAALLPDMDHPEGTIAWSLGPLTYWLCRFTAWAADGHRRRTHMWTFCVLMGLVVTLVAWLGGRWGAAVVALLLSSLGWRALSRRLRHVVPLLALGTAILTWSTYSLTVGLCLAVATTVGAWVHCLGDSLTNSGCAWAWPYRRKLGSPRWLRFSTGKAVEKWFTRVLYGLLGALVVLVVI